MNYSQWGKSKHRKFPIQFLSVTTTGWGQECWCWSTQAFFSFCQKGEMKGSCFSRLIKRSPILSKSSSVVLTHWQPRKKPNCFTKQYVQRQNRIVSSLQSMHSIKVSVESIHILRSVGLHYNHNNICNSMNHLCIDTK